MSNKLHEAITAMRASEDTYEQVMLRARGKGSKRRGYAMPTQAAAVLCVVCMLATGGVAMAATGFFSDAMGGHGMGSQSQWSVAADNGKESYSYVREYDVEVPAGIADKLEASIEPVGYTVEKGGYSFTVESMVADENGCGMCAFVLSNPEGVEIKEPERSGEVVFEDDSWLRDLQIVAVEDGVYLDWYLVCDRERSTKTELRGTMYFSEMSGKGFDALAQGVRWILAWDEGAGTACASSPVFEPAKVVPTLKLSDPAGYEGALSPFSLQVWRSDNSGYGEGELEESELIVEMEDGGKTVVSDLG